MIFPVRYHDKEYTISADSRKGKSELMLLFHGLACTKEYFGEMVGDTRFTNFSLLIPDLPGHGNSFKDKDFSYSMEEYAAVIQLLLRDFPYQKIHIVGHSMGGTIGVLLAEQLPQLATFTNIEGNLISEDCGIISRKTTNVSFDQFRDKAFAELQEKMGKSPEPGGKAWANSSTSTDPLAFYKSAQSLVLWSDGGELIKKFLALKAKKTYIYGEHNGTMPILDRLVDVQKIAIPHSGHFPMIDNSVGFYKTLAEMLCF